MPIKSLPIIQNFVDWVYKISLAKKVYLLMTLMAFGLIFLLKYYERQISTINTVHNNRIDSVTFFYTKQLENCNSESKEDYKKLVDLLQKSLEEQQKLAIETERLKIETEKLKSKK